ncbi:MAG TPA: cyclic nucleotide-binding domain-containing protein [Myxococcota bacterium]|nr:cyclic nucleotide-binding domain-containing protein [Myxococcota bacterium]HRY95033.1 cyclic nucleotide-binding domain-containing protein [Myxococcota bacterium]HSA21096.1 cyclic nucleotide-binding domain-containing protein [Myxococcota bacterium]
MNKAEVLQNSRLFAGLLPEESEMLADLCQAKRLPAGEVVFEQDEPGDSLCLLVEGEVDIIRKRTDGSGRVIASLSAPDFFGEMSLVDKEPRSATVRARTETSLLCLSNKNLQSFARVYKNAFTLVVINISRVLSARLRETNEKLASKL